jgi:hypothetical protein
MLRTFEQTLAATAVKRSSKCRTRSAAAMARPFLGAGQRLNDRPFALDALLLSRRVVFGQFLNLA